MSEEGAESTKQTLDLVIVNSTILKHSNQYDDLIRFYVSQYGLNLGFNLTIKEDELLYDLPTFERFPKDAVVYTHLAPHSTPHFITLAGVHKLTEDPALRKYRPDLRFIISMDSDYLNERKFFEYWGGDRELFDFLQKISKLEFDPANIVSPTYQRDVFEFFDSEPSNTKDDQFKDYVAKLLALRARQEKQTS